MPSLQENYSKFARRKKAGQLQPEAKKAIDFTRVGKGLRGGNYLKRN